MADLYYVKDLVKGFIKWFIIVMITLNLILWSFISASCQDHADQHKDLVEWEDSVRYRVADITSVSGDLIFWKKVTKFEVRLSSFGYDKTLQVEKGWTNKPTGCHQMWYCVKHQFVYMIYSLDKKYCKEK